MEVALLDSVLTPLTRIAPFICISISIFICGHLAVNGQMSIGEFVTINSFIMLIVGPLIGFGGLISIVQKGLASLDRITDFLRLPIESIDDSTEVLPLEDINIRCLDFNYENSKGHALSQVSTTIRKGSFIGIVGKPGSGKSTLFKLLIGLQECPEKSIYFGNQDLTNISLTKLRNSIAYVPTQSYLLSTTISDNIKFGKELPMHETVEVAAKKADLYRDLGDLLNNDLHKLAEEGQDLSGGQKQRINMARGFYKNAPYLLLDDCFSALDAITVTTILETLNNVKDQTILCISQRLEVIEKADKILVFDEGRIVEEGTHEELLAKKAYITPYMKRRKEGLVMKKRNFKNDWALFSYITAYIKPYLGILLLATIALAGNLVLLLLRPYLTKQVIDLGFATNDITVIEYYAVIYGLTIIGSVLFIFVENYFFEKLWTKNYL